MKGVGNKIFAAGIALLIACVLALLLSENARDSVGLTFDEVGQIGFFALILLLLAGGASKRLHFGEFTRNLATWVSLFMVVIIAYSYRTDIEVVAQRIISELRPGVVAQNGEGEVVVRANLNGSFEVLAQANDTSILFLFDTGATSVVLTFDDAHKADIDTQNLRFTVPVNTANGTGRAAIAQLDSLIIGDIARRNLRVLVSEPGQLDISLLGISFLETLESYTVRDAQLILKN